jgi:hypothetical protein
MKFGSFKEYRRITGTLEEVVEYLKTDLTRALKDLTVGLTRLKVVDNFDSFETTVTILAGQEVAIRNALPSREIPTKRIIVKGGTGAQDIVDGDTAWTIDYVYLKNLGLTDVQVTVLFLR